MISYEHKQQIETFTIELNFKPKYCGFSYPHRQCTLRRLSTMVFIAHCDAEQDLITLVFSYNAHVGQIVRRMLHCYTTVLLILI